MRRHTTENIIQTKLLSGYVDEIKTEAVKVQDELKKEVLESEKVLKKQG